MTNSPKDSRQLTAEDVLKRYSQSFPDFVDPLTDVNQAGTFGNRPLHLASHQGDLEAIRALVDGGADVNARGDLGSTPLHDAVEEGHRGSEVSARTWGTFRCEG
jgi:ankyrin repeat protein